MGSEMCIRDRRNLELFGEFSIGGNAIDAEAENLGIGGFEFCDIRLIRFQLFRSTTGEREHIDREYDVFLALEIA